MKNTKKHFYKTVNKNNYKEMWNFLKNHFQYYTMNSWNRTKSIANNVKVYNLKLDGDYWQLLEMLEIDNYFSINDMIKDWEMEHPGYEVSFNGRSGGYLVLYDGNSNKNILDNYLDYKTYNEFKEAIKDVYSGYGSLKNYKNELIEQVELVQSFDQLCDNLRDFCQHMLDNCTIEEKEIEYTETKTEKALNWG